MRRWTLALLIGILCTPMLALAEPICFQAIPFTDVFTFTVDIQSVSPLLATLTTKMEAAGLYQLGGAGALLVSKVTPVGNYAVRVSMANLSDFFGGNAVCALTATVSPDTHLGTWRLTCTGTPTPFSVPGSLAEMVCPGLVVAAHPSARALGDSWSVLREAARTQTSAATTPLAIEEVLSQLHAQGLTAAGEDVNNDVTQE